MVKSTIGDICKPGGKQGIFLPSSDAERETPEAYRAPIYLFFLVWCFIGVSIIADIFVGSIEAIASVRKKVKLKSGRIISLKVWNDTVANLSLMALGSSAPEIFLSFIELNSNSMYVGDLGPSTIVGSAAFNLLVIISVCMIAIPNGEVRLVKELNAFYVTAAFSLVAYLWLVWILVFNTQDRVDVIEAVITLFLLPCLIWISYLIDVGDARAFFAVRFFRGSRHDDSSEEASSGALRFAEGDKLVLGRPESETDTVSVSVSRMAFKEAIECCYRTEPFSAVPGYDYEHTEGTLQFAKGIDEMEIELSLLPNQSAKGFRELFLIVEDPGFVAGGDRVVDFDPEQDGGVDCAILTIALGKKGEEHDSSRSPGQCVSRCCLKDWLSDGMSEWKDQWTSVLFVNGSREEQAEASFLDWVWHVIVVPWNMLFSLVPPASLFNGWACFSCSLILIALVTAVILDLAELIGCVLQVPDVCTAITFVALGTSMPDLFASLSAAKSDPTADAAIVNVTGSNCVNVFLGLGLPWTIAAIYWGQQERIPGGKWETTFPQMAEKVKDKCVFVVESRNLGFSVLMFTAAFVVAVIFIIGRRQFLGAELGGPVRIKYINFAYFLSMWVGWVYIVSWRVINYDSMTFMEQVYMVGGVGCAEILLAICAFGSILKYWRKHRRKEEVEEVVVVLKEAMTDDEAADAPFQVAESGGYGGFRSKSVSAQSWNAKGTNSNLNEVPQFVSRKSVRKITSMSESSKESSKESSRESSKDIDPDCDAEIVLQTPETSRGHGPVLLQEPQNDLRAEANCSDPAASCSDQSAMCSDQVSQPEPCSDQVSQPEPEPITDSRCEVDSLVFPHEHSPRLVAAPSHVRLVSHTPRGAAGARSPPAPCTPRDTDVPRTPINCTPRSNEI